MNDNTENDLPRGKLILTLAVTTLVFFTLLGGAVWLHFQIPVFRENRVLDALERGDLAQARSYAAELDDKSKTQEYLQECDYREARSLMDEQRWEEAARLFSASAGYRDAASLKTECEYELALAFAGQEQWEEAETRFLALSGYRDAMERYNECRFRRALLLEESGRLREAAALYLQLGDFGPAKERLYSMAKAATGIEDSEAAIAALQGQTPEEMLHLMELGSCRESLPCGIVDVGFYHTVGLAADGTVLACGDDSFGQCQVSGIRNAAAVAAGAYHTLILHTDGHVSAVGRNSEAQCEVSDWQDIVQIAAGDYASFGLRADGSIVCTGYNDYQKTAGWRDLTAIAAGSYNVAGLRRDGGAWVYPAVEGGDALNGLVAIAVNTGFGLGLRPDGSLVGSAFVPEGWTDLVAIAASGTVVLGLRMDGTVLCHAFRARDALPLSEVTDAVAIAAGGTHSAVVCRDGRVLVFGEVSRGQGDTGSWLLAVDGGAR